MNYFDKWFKNMLDAFHIEVWIACDHNKVKTFF